MFEHHLHAASATSTLVGTGSAGERRSHTIRVEHGVIKPQQSLPDILDVYEHANGETAVLVGALEAVVNLD